MKAEKVLTELGLEVIEILITGKKMNLEACSSYDDMFLQSYNLP